MVTGVLSVVLLASAEEVEQTSAPSLWEAALTTGFALSLSAFFLTIAVGLSKKMLRDLRKIYHQRWTKCSICDEPLPEASLRQVNRLHSLHYATVHSDAWTWSTKWRRKLAIGIIALCVLLFVAGTYIVLVGNLSWVRSHGASYDSTLDVGRVAMSEASPVQEEMDSS